MPINFSKTIKQYYLVILYIVFPEIFTKIRFPVGYKGRKEVFMDFRQNIQCGSVVKIGLEETANGTHTQW